MTERDLRVTGHGSGPETGRFGHRQMKRVRISTLASFRHDR
jgi:hypothetical protein